MKLKEKIPSIAQVTPVLAVTAMMLYGWTTYRFIQKLPSWLLFLTTPEILANYTQTLVFNLVETLLVLGMILFLNLLVPKRFFGEMFIARGSLLSGLGLGYLMYLAYAIGASKLSQFPWRIFQWSPLVYLAILFLAVVLPYSDRVRKVVENFADRAIIFLYILTPLTGIGLLFFIYKNLF